MLEKPSNQEFKKIFDHIAPRYNQISNSYLVGVRKKIFQSWAKGKCLEVGAGTGEISLALQPNHQVIATDLAPGMVEEMKKNGLVAQECDAENLPFENNSFDTVICAETIFYLDHPDKFLSEAYRVLQPEGRLLISCASNFPVKFYDRFRAGLRSLGLKRGMYFQEDLLREFMTKPKLTELLNRNKFNIIRTKQTPILPLAVFGFLNKILEKTVFKNFGIFIFALATKLTD